jgi:hypothetical protein
MGRTRVFIQRQSILLGLALVAYLGVRFVTQGDVASAHRNARRVLEFEKSLGMDLEHGIQALFADDHGVITLANWIYVWGYWPVLFGTLVYLGVRHREAYFGLRNAMFISGAIGLVIFATYAVAPPRLFSVHYIDTVAQHSSLYGVIHPPSLANRYAAIPSFHFGWILLVSIAWYRVARTSAIRWAAVAMPAAMAFTVVVTANHWVIDILAGGAVSLAGLGLEHSRSRLFTAAGPIGPLGSTRLARALHLPHQELVIRVDAVEDRPRPSQRTGS